MLVKEGPYFTSPAFGQYFSDNPEEWEYVTYMSLLTTDYKTMTK